MAKIRFQGKEYDLPDSEDWTTGELSEAEHAVGKSFGGNSQGDSMAISFYIAVRRADSHIPPGALAEAVRNVKMGDLLTEDDESPPADAGTTPAAQEGPPISGTSD